MYADKTLRETDWVEVAAQLKPSLKDKRNPSPTSADSSDDVMSSCDAASESDSEDGEKVGGGGFVDLSLYPKPNLERLQGPRTFDGNPRLSPVQSETDLEDDEALWSWVRAVQRPPTQL